MILASPPRLSRQLRPLEHRPLNNLNDVAAFLEELPSHVAVRPPWRRVSDLVLDAVVTADHTTMVRLTTALEQALQVTEGPWTIPHRYRRL